LSHVPGVDLLEAIIARPDDLDARRVYADALLEAGDPLGEFIRLDLEMAALPRFDPRRPICARRRGTLLEEHRTAWLGPAADAVAGWNLFFRNGFIERARIKPGSSLVRLVAAAPVLRELDVHTIMPRLEDEAFTRRLTGLRLQQSLDVDEIVSLTRQLPSLVRLELPLRGMRPPEVPAALAALSTLSELTLTYVQADTLPAIAAASLPRLEKLTVFGRLSGPGLPALLGTTGYPALRRLVVRGSHAGNLAGIVLPPSLRELDLGTISEWAILSLLEGSHQDLEVLRLAQNHVGDPLAGLLTRRAWPHLRELDLRNNVLTDEGAEVLAGIDAPQLQYLDVSDGRFRVPGLSALGPLARRLRMLVAGSAGIPPDVHLPEDLREIVFPLRPPSPTDLPQYFEDLRDPDLAFLALTSG
jgi:uncharacterized protein (TIGR02996 family)